MRKYISVTNSLGLGGAERIAQFVHNQLIDEYGNDRVSIFALHSFHGKISRIFILTYIVRYLEAIIAIVQLTLLIIKNKDVVILSHMTQSNIVSRFFKLLKKDIKIVNFIHSNYELKNMIFRYFLTDNLVDRYIFISDHSLKAQNHFIDQKKSRVFHQYVDERVFHFDAQKRLRTRNHLNVSNDLIFVVAGRLSKEKKINQIINLWNETSINAMLIIVGSGPEHAFLTKLSKSNPRIKLIPAVQNIQDYYNAADVVISNSPDESYGLVINESLLCGCTVLARYGAHTDFFKRSFQRFETYNSMEELLGLIGKIQRKKSNIMSSRNSIRLKKNEQFNILQIIDS